MAFIVVMINGCAGPFMAFDAEVIVALCGQIALSGTAFQKALRQCDAGWYAVFLHLFDGYRLVLVDIVLILRAQIALCIRTAGNNQEE